MQKGVFLFVFFLLNVFLEKTIENAESRLCNLSCSGFPRNSSRSKEDFEDVNEQRRFAEKTPNIFS